MIQIYADTHDFTSIHCEFKRHVYMKVEETCLDRLPAQITSVTPNHIIMVTSALFIIKDTKSLPEIFKERLFDKGMANNANCTCMTDPGWTESEHAQFVSREWSLIVPATSV